jgi:hypothetical protein
MFLHVANGTSTTATLEATGIPGSRSIWADPLYEGPVPGGLSDEALLDVRARYLEGPTQEASADPVNDLKRWRQIIQAHDAYDELVLWFEHDLFDQLNLIQILSWIRTRLPSDKQVSLVCIGSFPGHPRFKGLGELSPDELQSLFETRRPIGDADYVLAERSWQALRDATPEALEALLRSDTSALPYLAAAIARFLQEYPWTGDGLSRSERRLLRLAEPGPMAVATAFPRMHDDEDAYYITDSSLLGLVATLSRTSPPLIAVTDGADAALNQLHGQLHGTVTLTDAGHDVLAGRADRVACGLDRWLGGVHLQSGAVIWRWDEDRRRVTRSSVH